MHFGHFVTEERQTKREKGKESMSEYETGSTLYNNQWLKNGKHDGNWKLHQETLK